MSIFQIKTRPMLISEKIIRMARNEGFCVDKNTEYSKLIDRILKKQNFFYIKDWYNTRFNELIVGDIVPDSNVNEMLYFAEKIIEIYKAKADRTLYDILIVGGILGSNYGFVIRLVFVNYDVEARHIYTEKLIFHSRFIAKIWGVKKMTEIIQYLF